ncbi:MAG: hypothetical protein QUS14_09290, partial [Pyrinomonadaceae bacterium]|nr:hypothetical protein [Pyrinomonadaceae bacterium]
DAKEVLLVVDELIARGQDLRNFCRDLMALVRDMTVFKVAGEADGLLDNAITGADKIKELAEPFSGQDLLRMFNSLAQTESKLKDVTQSRYTLELGLVRLVEMRRLAPIESILERLAALENGTAVTAIPTAERPAARASETSAPATARLAAEEKKTLVSEPKALEEPPMPDFSVHLEPPMPDKGFSTEPAVREEKPPEKPVYEPSDENWRAALPEDLRQRPGGIDLSFVQNLPAKLPPIEADELTHYEDGKLDEAFETALERSGEVLGPIRNASGLVDILTGKAAAEAEKRAERERDLSAYAPPELEPIDDNAPLPELTDDATDEELMAYAKAHPAVRRAMRIFRAQVVEVKRIS